MTAPTVSGDDGVNDESKAEKTQDLGSIDEADRNLSNG